MTSEQIAGIAGVILSLAFAYVPGLQAWYGQQDGVRKRLLMALLLVVAAAGALVWSCAQQGGGLNACLVANWPLYLQLLVTALVSNQATYVLAVRPSALPVPKES